MDTNIIYVQLLNEGTIAYRQTTGYKVSEEHYCILPTDTYDSEDEEWEYIPGTIVKCEFKQLDVGKVLVAVELDATKCQT